VARESPASIKKSTCLDPINELLGAKTTETFASLSGPVSSLIFKTVHQKLLKKKGRRKKVVIYIAKLSGGQGQQFVPVEDGVRGRFR